MNFGENSNDNFFEPNVTIRHGGITSATFGAPKWERLAVDLREYAESATSITIGARTEHHAIAHLSRSKHIFSTISIRNNHNPSEKYHRYLNDEYNGSQSFPNVYLSVWTNPRLIFVSWGSKWVFIFNYLDVQLPHGYETLEYHCEHISQHVCKVLEPVDQRKMCKSRIIITVSIIITGIVIVLVLLPIDV